MVFHISLALVFLNLWLFLFHIIHFHLGKIASFCPDPSDKYPQASAGLKANLKVVAAQIREWQREWYIFKQYFQLQIQTKRHFYCKNGMGWMKSNSLDCYNFYSGTKKGLRILTQMIAAIVRFKILIKLISLPIDVTKFKFLYKKLLC